MFTDDVNPYAIKRTMIAVLASMFLSLLCFVSNSSAQSITASTTNASWTSKINPLTLSLSETPAYNTVKVTFTGTSGAAVGTTVAVNLQLARTSYALSVYVKKLSSTTVLVVATPTAAFLFATPSTVAALPDGGYTVTASYQRTSTGATIPTSSGLSITLDTSSFVPSFTAPTSATVYGSLIPIAFDINESYTAGTAKLVFENSGGVVNTITLSDGNLSATSFNLSTANVLASDAVIISTTAATIPDDTYSVVLTYTESTSASTVTSTKTAVVVDTTAPSLVTTFQSGTVTTDSTPNITLNSSEAGTITYTGGCGSTTSVASAGDNIITLAANNSGTPLADGTYGSCAIGVTDSAGNFSTLSIGTLNVDTTSPSLAEITPVLSFGSDQTPNVTFSSSEAGSLAYSGGCQGATTSVTVGNNTITLAASSLGYGLPDGTYSSCTLLVADLAASPVSTLLLSSFIIDSTRPTAPNFATFSNPTRDNTPTISYTLTEAGLGVTFTSSINGLVGSATSTSGSNQITLNALSDGAHTITVAVTDAASNSTSVQFSLTVDTTSPLITLLGSNSVDVVQNATYTDSGATATDAISGTLTSNIVTVNAVNSSIAGAYAVTYYVVDSAGNSDTKTRSVTVLALTPTPTSTAIPTATAVPTSTVLNDEVGGQIIDSIGSGVPNALVYLYQIGNLTNAIDIESAIADGEVATASTSTNSDGYFLFKKLAPGTYKISPSTTGLSFDPITISIDAGIQATAIVATTAALNDEGCTSTSYLQLLLSADAKNKLLVNFVRAQIARGNTLAAKRLGAGKRAVLNNALRRAGVVATRAFTAASRASQSLPTKTLACNGKQGCAAQSYKVISADYRLRVSTMGRQGTSVLRTLSNAFPPNLNVVTNKIKQQMRLLSAEASKSALKLPSKSDICAL